jgi:hypothetical protein
MIPIDAPLRVPMRVAGGEVIGYMGIAGGAGGGFGAFA